MDLFVQQCDQLLGCEEWGGGRVPTQSRPQSTGSPPQDRLEPDDYARRTHLSWPPSQLVPGDADVGQDLSHVPHAVADAAVVGDVRLAPLVDVHLANWSSKENEFQLTVTQR